MQHFAILLLTKRSDCDIIFKVVNYEHRNI